MFDFKYVYNKQLYQKVYFLPTILQIYILLMCRSFCHGGRNTFRPYIQLTINTLQIPYCRDTLQSVRNPSLSFPKGRTKCISSLRLIDYQQTINILPTPSLGLGIGRLLPYTRRMEGVRNRRR